MLLDQIVGVADLAASRARHFFAPRDSAAPAPPLPQGSNQDTFTLPLEVALQRLVTVGWGVRDVTLRDVTLRWSADGQFTVTAAGSSMTAASISGAVKGLINLLVLNAQAAMVTASGRVRYLTGPLDPLGSDKPSRDVPGSP